MNQLLEVLEQVEKFEDELRDHINSGVLHNFLLNDKHKWWMLCSALDVLGDTVIAFGDYLKSEFPVETGRQYLSIYGLMQCFILQQDSIKHLYEIFDVEFKLTPNLKKIRKIRNSSIGHTVLNNEGGNKEKDKNEFNNFISRMTIEKSGFDLLRYSKKIEDTVYENINVYELLQEQLHDLIELITRLITEIKSMENELKKKFESEKLVELLPISYWFEKIHSIYHPQNRVFSYTALSNIEKSYIQLKDALGQRLLHSEYYFDEINDYIVAIDLMKKALDANDDRASRIYSFYLSQKNEDFKSLMHEIDEKYEIKNPL